MASKEFIQPSSLFIPRLKDGTCLSGKYRWILVVSTCIVQLKGDAVLMLLLFALLLLVDVLLPRELRVITLKSS